MTKQKINKIKELEKNINKEKDRHDKKLAKLTKSLDILKDKCDHIFSNKKTAILVFDHYKSCGICSRLVENNDE